MVELGLRGRAVTAQTVEYTLGLELTDGYYVRIESPFTVMYGADRISLSPEEDAAEAFEPLRRLIGQTILESTSDETGALTIVFEDGTRLLVNPDSAYEAWTVTGPDGMMIVCMAGGELAVWSGEPHRDA